MIGLIQRVIQAEVKVENRIISSISHGILALIAVEKSDTCHHAERLLNRIIQYRIFPDEKGKMNRNLLDSKGGLILVPQFTLAADTKKGTRPSFSSAASADQGKELFEHMLNYARDKGVEAGSGQFGADMKVSLTNDGPVTFWLKV